MKPLSHHSIVLVGAGPVGMLCALLLQRQRQDVLLLEARPEHTVPTDKRTLALSYHSIRLFQAAGVDLGDVLTPITAVHVSRTGKFGRTVLTAQDVSLPYLGATVDYAVLLVRCEDALRRSGVGVAWNTKVQALRTVSRWAQIEAVTDCRPAQGNPSEQRADITAQWVLLAEGGALAGQLPGVVQRSLDYRQMALVGSVSFDRPNDGTAYERFTDTGPVALLPQGRNFKLVWTCTPEEAEARRNMNQAAFADMLSETFGSRLGRLTSVGNIAAFPLYLRQLNKVHSGRVICLGNAAQTMHPVAAQGLNLGVRDAETLADVLGTARNLDDAALAARYAAKRRLDAHAVVGFTHGLVHWFDHAGKAVGNMQGIGMGLLNTLVPLRRAFTRRLVFGMNGTHVPSERLPEIQGKGGL